MLQVHMVLFVIGVNIALVKSDTTCPDGWLPFEGSCYLFGHVESSMHFTTAMEYCRHHSSHLVHVGSSDENDFLKDRMRQLKPTTWWMGLTDEFTEGHWAWTGTNTPATFLDFKPDDHAHNDQDCAMFDLPKYDFKWADATCTGHRAVPLCEKPGWTDNAIVG